MTWVLALAASVASAQNFDKFKPPRDVAPEDSPSLFGRATRAMERDLTDCKYVVDQTKVGMFKKDQFCNGIAIKFCFARIACASHKTLLQKGYAGDPTGKTMDRSCPAVDGKCPANPEDCMKAGGFEDLSTGRGAIASGAPTTSGREDATTGR